MDSLLPLLAGLGTGLALIVAIGVQNTYLLRLAVSAGLRVVTAAVLVCAVSDAVLILAGVLGVGAVVERFPVALVVIRYVGAAFLLTYGVLAARRAIRPSGDAIRVDSEARVDGVPLTAPPSALRSSTRASATAPPSATTTSVSVTLPAGEQRAPTHQGAASARGRDAATLAAEPARRRRAAPPDRGGVTMRTAVVTMLVFTWANPHVYLDTLVFLGSVANQQGVEDRWWWTVGAVAASCLWFSALGFGGRLLRPVFARPGTWRVFDGLVALVMLGFGVALALGA